MYIPTGRRMDFFCNDAPKEICSLLELGKLQRVRFLYGNANENVRNCRFREEARRPLFQGHITQYRDQWEYLEAHMLHHKKPDTFVVTRELFDNERFSSGNWSSWPDAVSVYRLERPFGWKRPKDANNRLTISEEAYLADDKEFEERFGRRLDFLFD
jgi:hypothetical protein